MRMYVQQASVFSSAFRYIKSSVIMNYRFPNKFRRSRSPSSPHRKSSLRLPGFSDFRLSQFFFFFYVIVHFSRFSIHLKQGYISTNLHYQQTKFVYKKKTKVATVHAALFNFPFFAFYAVFEVWNDSLHPLLWNLPTNFNVSETYGPTPVHGPRNLATITFNLKSHGACRAVIRVFVLYLYTKTEVRRPSTSEDIAHFWSQY